MANDLIDLADNDLAGKPHMEELRTRVLEKALAYYHQFMEQSRDDHAAQADLAGTEARVKRILEDLVLMQGAGQLLLLKDKDRAVLDDLRLSIEQAKRIEELSRRMEARQKDVFRDFHRLTDKEREQRVREMFRANEGDVAAILTQEQRNRLRQIELQRKGTGAFREANILKELKLTLEQKKRIEAIEAETFFFRGPPVATQANHPSRRPRPPWKKSSKQC